MMNNTSFIKTHQISSEIIEIIDNSDQFCILVTPYILFWEVLEKSFKGAYQKRKKVTFILTDDREGKNRKTALHINNNYGFEVFIVENLHAKIFLNEKTSLICSMNLYNSSQIKNFEVGVLYKNSSLTSKQIKQDLIDDYILSNTPIIHLKRKVVLLSTIENPKEFLAEKGFCVTCGAKIDFEAKTHPIVVRCRSCYFKSPSINPSSRVMYCHYCGKKVKSTFDEPFHEDCKLEWEEIAGSIKVKSKS